MNAELAQTLGWTEPSVAPRTAREAARVSSVWAILVGQTCGPGAPRPCSRSQIQTGADGSGHRPCRGRRIHQNVERDCRLVDSTGPRTRAGWSIQQVRGLGEEEVRRLSLAAEKSQRPEDRVRVYPENSRQVTGGDKKPLARSGFSVGDQAADSAATWRGGAWGRSGRPRRRRRAPAGQLFCANTGQNLSDDTISALSVRRAGLNLPVCPFDSTSGGVPCR